MIVHVTGETRIAAGQCAACGRTGLRLPHEPDAHGARGRRPQRRSDRRLLRLTVTAPSAGCPDPLHTRPYAATDVEAGVDQHGHEADGLPNTDDVVAVELVHRGAGHGDRQLALALGAHQLIASDRDDRCGDVALPIQLCDV
jgi:hypothetical protein